MRFSSYFVLKFLGLGEYYMTSATFGAIFYQSYWMLFHIFYLA